MGLFLSCTTSAPTQLFWMYSITKPLWFHSVNVSWLHTSLYGHCPAAYHYFSPNYGNNLLTNSFLKKILFIYLFRERGREGEKEGKKHRCVVIPHMTPTGDPVCNLGESNQWPFGPQASTQSIEPHQPGVTSYIHSWPTPSISYRKSKK